MAETMYGREVQLNDLVLEGAILMHPKTWEAIKPVHRRNEVVVKIGNAQVKTFKVEADKVEADGDTVYVQGKNLREALDRFIRVIREINRGLLTWTEVDSLPEGEEAL
jgi:hypothetical protein